MRMRRAQHIGARIAGTAGIIDIAAAATQQRLVFLAPDRLANRLHRHRLFSPGRGGADYRQLSAEKPRAGGYLNASVALGSSVGVVVAAARCRGGVRGVSLARLSRHQAAAVSRLRRLLLRNAAYGNR